MTKNLLNTFTNHMQNIVGEFQLTFGHPYEKTPVLPDTDRFISRKCWGVLEEVVEQIHTVSNDQEEFSSNVEKLVKAIYDAKDKQSDKEFIADPLEKIYNLADGLGDEGWFWIGDLVEMGIDIEPIIEIIRLSNLSKQFTAEDGSKYFEYDDKGKVLKSPEFFAPEPEIKKEIIRQMNRIKKIEKIPIMYTGDQFYNLFMLNYGELLNIAIDEDREEIHTLYITNDGEIHEADLTYNIAYNLDEMFGIEEDKNYEYSITEIAHDFVKDEIHVEITKKYVGELA